MGDIDNLNFSEELISDFTQSISESTLVSIDLEMTGISFPGSATENGADTVPFRYEKIREIAKQFGVIQIGISIFSSDDRCRVFNFYTFPRPVTEGGEVNSIPLITLCSASTNFNRSNGMDFGRWIDRGITYVDANTEEKLRAAFLGNANSREKAWERLLGGFSIDSSITSLDEYISQEKKILAEIDSFLDNESVVNYKVPFVHGGQRWLKSILTTIHAKFPGLGLVEEVSGGGSSRVLTKRPSEEIFNDYIGFRRIWNILREASVPVVFHNGFLDLVFCYQHFENPLPATLIEFKQALAQTFKGGFYDTRLVAIESGLSMAGSAALETMADMMKSEAAFQAVQVVNSGQYDSSNMNDERFHDAGYDSLLTGKVFLALKSKLNGDVDKYKNFMCISRCIWVLSMDTPDSDRLLSDVGTGKNKIVRVISGMTDKVSTRDVLSQFEEVKQLAPNTTVNAQWIDDASALLILTWSQPADKTIDSVVMSMNSKLMEIVKAGGSLGNSARLISTEELMKKQLDDFNGASVAHKKFRL
jgi:hypothetical protein